jgi:sugar lactone lactonase YvrE
MLAVGNELYVVEANSGQLLKVTTGGQISRIVDFSVNHPVPSSITYHGNFYIGTFGSAGTNFAAAVYEVTPSGQKRTVISGLNPVLGLAVRRGKLYVLETYSGDPFSPGTGRLLRVSFSGKIEKTQFLSCGLTFPTSMTVGADEALYISHVGYGADPAAAAGEVIRVAVED